MANLTSGTYYIVVYGITGNNTSPNLTYSGSLVYNSGSGSWAYQGNTATSGNANGGSISWTSMIGGSSVTFATGTYTAGSSGSPSYISGGTVSIGGIPSYLWSWASGIPTGSGPNYQVTCDPPSLSGTLNANQNKFTGATNYSSNFNTPVQWVTANQAETYSAGQAYVYSSGGSSNVKYGMAFGNVSPVLITDDGTWMADSM